MSAGPLGPPGGAAVPSPTPPTTRQSRSRRRWRRRPSAPTPRVFSRLSLLVLATAVAVAAASEAIDTRDPIRQLVEAVGSAPDWTVFVGKFSGGEENPPRDTPATGTVAGMVWGRDLHLRWTFSKLITGANEVHIHNAAPGQNNPGVVVDLFPLTTLSQPRTAGRGYTTVTLTPKGLVAAAAGDLYLNIHTTGMPNGEVRSQLWPVSADELAKTGNMTSAATAAVVAAGRRREEGDGGAKSAAVAVGVIAAVVAVGAVLTVGARSLWRRKGRQQAEMGQMGGSPRDMAAAVASEAAAGAAAPKGPRTPPNAEFFAQEKEPRGDAWPRVGALRAAAPAADDECDDQIAPLSPHTTASSGTSRTTDGRWRSPDALRRSASSMV